MKEKQTRGKIFVERNATRYIALQQNPAAALFVGVSDMFALILSALRRDLSMKILKENDLIRRRVITPVCETG